MKEAKQQNMASAEEPTAQYPLLNSGEAIVSGYKQRQCGSFWIMVLLGGYIQLFIHSLILFFGYII